MLVAGAIALTAAITSRLRLGLALLAVWAVASGRAHLRPESLGGLYEKAFLGIELAWFLVAAAWIAHGARSPSLNRVDLAADASGGR